MSRHITEHVIVNGELNKITEVVVFFNQAHVRRQVESYTQVGLNRLFIELKAFMVDPHSVQARVFGNGEILGVQYKEVPVLAAAIKQPDVAYLRSEQRRLEQQQRVFEYKQRNCVQQRQFLDSMVNFSRLPVNPASSSQEKSPGSPTAYWNANDLKEALENAQGMLSTLSHNYMAILQEEDGYINELQTVKEQLELVNTKLNLAIPNVAITHKNIEILFASKTAENIKIEVVYVVAHAAWKPFYKVDVGLNLNQVTITMFAHVEQTTGEDWQGVRLSVSNAMPTASTRLPELYSLRVGTNVSSYNNSYTPTLTAKANALDETAFLSDFDRDECFPNDDGDAGDTFTATSAVDPMAEAEVYVAYGRYEQAADVVRQALKTDPNNKLYKDKLAEISAIIRASTTAVTKTDATVPPPPKSQREAKFSQAQEIKTSVAFEYQLPLLIDINSGSGETLLPMSSKDLNGNFFYYAVPKQDPLVYLVCEANLAGATLLTGQLNIHFGGRFVGNTFLDEKKAGKDLLINLGAVRDVKIQRKKITNQVAESLLSGMMDRSNVVHKLEFSIIVENLKNEDIQIKILDAIPVAVTDRIQIKNVLLKPDPEITDWQQRKGVMRWSLALSSKQTKEIHIQYLIKHPKNYPLEPL